MFTSHEQLPAHYRLTFDRCEAINDAIWSAVHAIRPDDTDTINALKAASNLILDAEKATFAAAERW